MLISNNLWRQLRLWLPYLLLISVLFLIPSGIFSFPNSSYSSPYLFLFFSSPMSHLLNISYIPLGVHILFRCLWIIFTTRYSEFFFRWIAYLLFIYLSFVDLYCSFLCNCVSFCLATVFVVSFCRLQDHSSSYFWCLLPV